MCHILSYKWARNLLLSRHTYDWNPSETCGSLTDVRCWSFGDTPALQLPPCHATATIFFVKAIVKLSTQDKSCLLQLWHSFLPTFMPVHWIMYASPALAPRTFNRFPLCACVIHVFEVDVVTFIQDRAWLKKAHWATPNPERSVPVATAPLVSQGKIRNGMVWPVQGSSIWP